jgi:hypothetical protein
LEFRSLAAGLLHQRWVEQECHSIHERATGACACNARSGTMLVFFA